MCYLRLEELSHAFKVLFSSLLTRNYPSASSVVNRAGPVISQVFQGLSWITLAVSPYLFIVLPPTLKSPNLDEKL